MSSFTNPLVVSPLVNGCDWELVRAFEYHVGALGSGELIQVPAGFVTDFASVPRLLFFLVPPWGRYGKATVIHDFCYVTELYPRRRCDDIFLEAMEVLNVALWRRWIMYQGVRLFGWLVWGSHTEESVRAAREMLEPGASEQPCICVTREWA